MSTWISKAILFSLLISGCVAPDVTGGAGEKAVEQPRSIVVSGVKLAGPNGFCPLPGTRQSVGGAEFVAFAPCDGRAAAILAATVGAQGSADGLTLTHASLAPYFQTEEGKAALRGAGSRDIVAVQEVGDYKGAVILRLTRQAKGQVSSSWRALMQVRGRLVTLTLRPRQGQIVDQTEGRRQITRFVDALRSGNGL